MNGYKINSEAEIKQLKLDLMNSKDFLSLIDNSTTNIPSHLNNIKNEDKEKIFNQNVREILRQNFESKDNDIDKNLKYREIKFCEEVKIVSFKFPQSMKIVSTDCLFLMKEDGSLIIRGLKLNDIPMLSGEKGNLIFYIGNNELFISETKNIEMNGAFKINDFNVDSFNKNEISLIYNNVEISEKPFEYIAIESAFNKANISDMISKMKRDKLFLEKMISKRIFYCGIMNIEESDNSYMNFNYDCDSDCVIIGIKNSIFFGKDVSKNYDWENIKGIKFIKPELREKEFAISSVDSPVSSIESRVASLETRVSSMESRIVSIESRFVLMESSVESRFASIESRVTSLESRVTSIENVLKQLVNEVHLLNSKFTQLIEKKQKDKELDDRNN